MCFKIQTFFSKKVTDTTSHLVEFAVPADSAALERGRAFGLHTKKQKQYFVQRPAVLIKKRDKKLSSAASHPEGNS